MYRIVLVAPTDEIAERLARPAFKDWFDKLEHLWREHGIEAPLIGALREYETARSVGALVVGSPERVVDELAAQVEISGVNYVLTEIAFGDLAHEDEMASLDLFIDQVKPALANPS
jgi:alkanesulfonate monooxygenase SsuD/methylene tetrahydromethanopterin reductase-like flavin-dependent oxidoreductase (luciferase family)